MNLIYSLCGFFIGVLILYLYLEPKIKTAQKLDKDTAIKNEHLQIELLELNKEHAALIAKKEEILLTISSLQKQAEEASNIIYEKSYELANERMNNAAELMSKRYQDLEKKAQDEYLLALENYASSFQDEIAKKQQEIDEANKKLTELTEKLTSAIEAAKREEELKLNQDFYRLQLSSIDLEEIEKLKSIAPYLRDSEPLNKVIWKVYYEKPYTALIGRVIGQGTHTGIYKITNIKNQMCYIGQAKNLADRWKQHIKRGLGAETPTRNKLYPAMLEYGVENFTFEIIEEVEANKLNEREDYWQEYFHAKDYGYSIK